MGWSPLNLGRTHLLTRRQRTRLLFAAALAAVGTAGSLWLAAATISWWTHNTWQWPQLSWNPAFGSLLDLNDTATNQSAAPVEPAQGSWFPVDVSWPSPIAPTLILSALLWAGWLVFVVRLILRGARIEYRYQALAKPKTIAKLLGAKQVRRSARYTLPTTNRLRRLGLGTQAFGYKLGTPIRPRSRRAVWADWEQRIRIIARTGWGKTGRLIIPIIRNLPGPAMISSNEPSIFTHTIHHRQHRRQPRRGILKLLPPAPTRAFPVAVVEFSPPGVRWADGFPQVRWELIADCADYAIAKRRATSLVSGTDTGDKNADRDRFFRDSAAAVIAAWLHAAALGNKTLADLLAWQRDPTLPTPTRILEDHRDTDLAAIQDLKTHLDRRAEKTTSSVLRFVALALAPLATADGRMLCGDGNSSGADREELVMVDLIRRGGTLYLLADSNRIGQVRPLLSLLAAEMFLAAETVATTTKTGRLLVPFIGVLDELRHGITVPNLPYVASAQRKYGIGFVYTVQSSTQEDAVYGNEAGALRDACGITIVGGIDIGIANQLADRTGKTTVVTASRTHQQYSESLQLQDGLTVADQQKLADGEAVILGRGIAPFVVHIPSIYDKHLWRRRTRSSQTATVDLEAAGSVEAVRT